MVSMICRCLNFLALYLAFTSQIGTPSVCTATPENPNWKYHGISPRELICDGYGKCRHKIANSMEKMKEAVVDVEEEAMEAVKDVVTRTPIYYSSMAGVVHLLGFATAYGTCVWFTLASSYVLGTALSHQQFEMVQSKLHPVYFRAMAYSVGIAIFGQCLMMGLNKNWLLMDTVQGFNLVASLAMIFINFLYLEPRATKVASERMKKDKEDEAEAKPRIVRRWNEQALLRRLNAVTLVSLTCHLLHLTHHLHSKDMPK